MVWDDTAYGRWQCDGQTLNASITNNATSLAIATTAGKPAFTTSAGAYPLNIQIRQEQITFTSAPGCGHEPADLHGRYPGRQRHKRSGAVAEGIGAIVQPSGWAL